MHGVFLVSHVYSVHNGKLNFRWARNTVQVTRKLTPISFFAPDSLYDCGQVKLNGIRFCKFMNHQFVSYFDTTDRYFVPPFIWTVDGSTIFGSFQYTDNNTFGICEGFRFIPDTLNKGQEEDIGIFGFDTDSVTVSLQIGPTQIKKSIGNDSKNFHFNPSDYKYILSESSETAYFELSLDKRTFKWINGRNYCFQVNVTIYNDIFLKDY